MSTANRKEELKRLNDELETIRQGFLRIIDKAHEAINRAPLDEVDDELAQLNAERKALSSRYRQVLGRMEALEALDA